MQEISDQMKARKSKRSDPGEDDVIASHPSQSCMLATNLVLHPANKNFRVSIHVLHPIPYHQTNDATQLHPLLSEYSTPAHLPIKPNRPYPRAYKNITLAQYKSEGQDMQNTMLFLSSSPPFVPSHSSRSSASGSRADFQTACSAAGVDVDPPLGPC